MAEQKATKRTKSRSRLQDFKDQFGASTEWFRIRFFAGKLKSIGADSCFLAVHEENTKSAFSVNSKFTGMADKFKLLNFKLVLQHTCVPDSPYLTATDGLLARKSGEWAKRKHHFLRNYCGITTTSMHKKWKLVYVDVMAGPGRCKIKETEEEFPGSPFVALDYGFREFIFIEGDPNLARDLKARIKNHPKASSVEVIPENWVNVANSGRLRFTDDTLVVAFVDPTGISQVPMKAMIKLTENRRIDLLVTIQYRLGITWNVPQYKRSEHDNTALEAFLDSGEWRNWKYRDESEFAEMAIDAFSKRIEQERFIGARHISVPPANPLYRFTLFSRHPQAEEFWNKILKIDETGQRELL